MGRKSQKKPVLKGGDPLAKAIRHFTAPSLFALLEAASVSPRAAHRAPSIAALFDTAVRRNGSGSRSATAADLPELVRNLHRVNPSIAMLEDMQPYDIRSEVLTRWGTDVFRMVPGSLERPTAMINQHALLAASIDGFLRPELGFGLNDVGEVILRRLDRVVELIAPHWPGGSAADVGAEPSVTEAEVTAAQELPSFQDILDSCSDSDRARLAAAHFVPPSGTLGFDHAAATFGPVIGARHRDGEVWLPAGMLIESLPAIGAQLSRRAANINGHANTTFDRAIVNHAGRLLLGSGYPITGPIRVGSSRPIHSLVMFGERQILALDIAAGLTPGLIQAHLDEGARVLEQVQPGVEVRNPSASWNLPANAQIVRLQVVAGPMDGSPLGVSGPMMNVEDLEWILRSTQESSEDLWYFVRDLADSPGVGRMFAWDVIDQWEVWKPEKSFYRGGVAVTSMMFSPHAAVVEWEAAAEAAPTERALHHLGLPPLRNWPYVALNHQRGTEVGDLRTDRAYQIMPWSVPVAVGKIDPDGPLGLASTLLHLAVGIAWKLEHSVEAFIAAAVASDLEFLRIEFEYRERNVGPALTVENVDLGVLTVGWDDRLQSILAEDSFAVETLCGELVSNALAEDERARFTAAWEAAPAGVRIDGFTVRQQVTSLPEPLKAHDSLRSAIRRRLGDHLASAEVEPTILEGDTAKLFESRSVFPWLKQEFHESIAHLRADELLTFALNQLEHANHHRFMLDKRHSWQQGFPVQGEDNTAQRREQMVRTTRVISFIIEEVLVSPPEGEVSIDDFEWTNALSAADLCIESCFRSDAIHHQLDKVSVEISDLYEVNVIHSGEPTDVDIAAYSDARSAAMQPAPAPIAANQHLEDDAEVPQPQSVLAQLPELTKVDNAMKISLGFGIDSIIGALDVARQWDSTLHSPSTLTTSEAIARKCDDIAVGVTPSEYMAALDWLTLRRSDLDVEAIPHWETERRAKRIATSPFVGVSNGLWVLPWTAEMALRIFLNYLSDGRLSRPNPSLPSQVTRALDQYRQQRNREVEKSCVSVLIDRGFLTQGSVKPEKAAHFGIASLSGEIDALCIDTQRSRIWVIEAKDPYTPYSPYQTRRLINDFLASGAYVDKLLCKVIDIEASAVGVAAALRAPAPDRTWTVAGLMVTRRVEPAAFAVEPQVAFCILDDLAEIIDQDELPGPGLHTRRSLTGE
jgi:hypothetical protein